MEFPFQGSFHWHPSPVRYLEGRHHHTCQGFKIQANHHGPYGGETYHPMLLLVAALTACEQPGNHFFFLRRILGWGLFAHTHDLRRDFIMQKATLCKKRIVLANGSKDSLICLLYRSLIFKWIFKFSKNSHSLSGPGIRSIRQKRHALPFYPAFPISEIIRWRC